MASKQAWWVDNYSNSIRPFPFDLLSFAPIGYDPRYVVPTPLCTCRGPTLEDRYRVSELLLCHPTIYQEWIQHALPTKPIRTKRSMGCSCKIDYGEITRQIRSMCFSIDVDKDMLLTLLKIHTGYHLI